VAVAGAVAFAAAASAQQNIVAIDGSSTVYPVTEAVAEEFQKKNPGYKVTVGVSGTGGGFKKFCRAETDISDASRPITKKEAANCKAAGVAYIELPVALDALAVLVNPKNTWAGEMTVAELKKIWVPEAQGKIMNWKQVREGFPDSPLTLFGAGVDSGTYDYFTAAITGKEHSSRGDFTASEDDNVLVQGISGDENALGFFGLAYYVENKDKLKAVGIIEKAGGKAVLPSLETALNGTYQPLSRPIFIYVNKKSMETKPHVKKFVEFYMDEKQSAPLAKEVGYVPLPSKAYAVMADRVKKMEVGSAFGEGPVIGVSIGDLIKLPIKH